MVKSYESIREEERSSQPSVEGLGGWVERDVVDVVDVGIAEANVEEEDAARELAVVEVKGGGGMRRMDGRSR